MTKKEKNLLDRLLDLCLVIVNVLLLLLILIVILDVIMTYVLKEPLEWALEISEYALAFIAFIGAGWLMREEGHLRFDMILERLPKRARAVMEVFVSVICLLVSIVIVWTAMGITMDLLVKGTLTVSILQLPRWILIVSIPIGFTILALQLIRRSYQHMQVIKAAKQKEEIHQWGGFVSTADETRDS